MSKETGLVEIMAKEQHLNAATYAETVRSVACPPNISKEQFTAFLMVCHEHQLNPITREIYGFESRGKVQPIVSIDGWLKIINSHQDFDGMEFEDVLDGDGKLAAITCRIYRKNRKHPTEVTEYMAECKRNTEVWKNWPARMLRHKATIQAARYAFGFVGIYDQDEVERASPIDMGDAEVIDVEPEKPAERLKDKIKAKVEKEDLAPDTDADAAAEAEMAAAGGQPEDDISLEDIPGLEKASEIHDAEMTEGQKEWLDDHAKAGA